jgi:ferredoxin
VHDAWTNELISPAVKPTVGVKDIRCFEVPDMKIRIEKAQCVGNARCHAVADRLYPLDDDGYIAIEGFKVNPNDELLARRGAKACPERIIFVIEDDSA